ncbi:hypothetical protein HK098_003972 [Nowakowskiella sp. JEL0407]|nr:hypothetical protein HK098_003972 [Nowakowskiella sp. JEL0407]
MDLQTLPREIIIHVASFLNAPAPSGPLKVPSTISRYSPSPAAYYELKFPLLSFALTCKEIYSLLAPTHYYSLDLKASLFSSIASAGDPESYDEQMLEFSSKVTLHTRSLTMLILFDEKNLEKFSLIHIDNLESLDILLQPSEKKVRQSVRYIYPPLTFLQKFSTMYTQLRKFCITCEDFHGDLLPIVTGILRTTKTIEELHLAINIVPDDLLRQITEFSSELSSLKHLKRLSFNNENQVSQLQMFPMDVILDSLANNLKLEDLSLIFFDFRLGVLTLAALKRLVLLNRLKRVFLDYIDLHDDFIPELVDYCASVNLKLCSVAGPSTTFRTLYTSQTASGKIPSPKKYTLAPDVSFLFESVPGGFGLEALKFPQKLKYEPRLDDSFKELIFSTMEGHSNTLRELTLVAVDILTLKRFIGVIKKSKQLRSLSIQIQINNLESDVMKDFYEAVRGNREMKSLSIVRIQKDLVSVVMPAVMSIISNGVEEVTVGFDTASNFQSLFTFVSNAFELFVFTAIPPKFRKCTLVFDSEGESMKVLEVGFKKSETFSLRKGALRLRLFNFSMLYGEVTNKILNGLVDGLTAKIVVDDLAEAQLRDFEKCLNDYKGCPLGLNIFRGEICVRILLDKSERASLRRLNSIPLSILNNLTLKY